VIEGGVPVEEAAADLDVDPSTAERLASMCTAAAHKRSVPPTPGLGGRSRSPHGSDGE